MTAKQNLPKKKPAAFIVSLSIEPHLSVRKLITRPIFGGYHDFSSCSSRFGQQNFLCFAGGECIHFYFAVVVDHSPSLRAGSVKPLNCRPYRVLVGLRQFLLNQIPDIELYLSLSFSAVVAIVVTVLLRW